MAKAAQGYHKRDLYSDVTARIPGELQTGGAVMTLARWHAREAVKQELYAQGIKVAHVEASDALLSANLCADDDALLRGGRAEKAGHDEKGGDRAKFHRRTLAKRA